MIKLVSGDKNIQQYSPMIIIILYQHVVCCIYVLPPPPSYFLPPFLPPPFLSLSLSLSPPLLQFTTDPSVLPFIWPHHQQCHGGRGVEQPRTSMCVERSSLASRLGYQQLMTASNSPIVGLVCLLYFWCFILKLST